MPKTDRLKVYTAAAAEALAQLWGEPSQAQIVRWKSKPFQYDMRRIIAVLQGGKSQLPSLFQGLGAEVAEILDEYERLFVGPGTVDCPPYEAYWRPRKAQDMTYGTVSGKVADIYDALGMRLNPELHELPDHMAVEWEALAVALHKDDKEIGRILFFEHLAQWQPVFLKKVTVSARQPFYVALAGLTTAWLSAFEAQYRAWGGSETGETRIDGTM